ncbi:MAG: TonB-dependent receptor [Gemmatimonadaceae bacterium]|nr:TonB-dependent receptor [Gemmatimonadaceae bacterium]
MSRHRPSSRASRKARLTVLALPFAVVPFAANRLEAQQRDTSRAQNLSQVVISASGTDQQRAAAPASITVLTREQMLQQRNGSLAEALRSIEGVDVGDTQGKTGGLNISVRGMPSDYTLILIDGRRQNSAGSITPNGFGETSTSFLPPVAAIERIEVIRGPMATLYGSDAMGGVINIITRRSTPRWTGSFTSDATLQQTEGFGNIYSGNLFASGPLVTRSLQLSVRGSLLQRAASALEPTGEFADNTTISMRGPSPVEGIVQTLGAKLRFTPGRSHELSLDFDDARQRYENDAAQLGTLDNAAGTPPSFNGYGPELRFNRSQAAVAHTWRFGRGRLESSLMHNVTETIGRTLPSGTPGGLPGSGAPNKPAGAPRTLESTSDVLDTRLVSMLGRHLLTVGGQYWDAKMVDGVALQPFEQTQWSIFAEDQWSLPANVTLTLGVRRDQHDSFGDHTSPRAYAVWKVHPTLSLKAGVSAGYKTPRLEQLVDGIIGFTAQGRTATIGTPGLKPETSVSSEIGFVFEGTQGIGASLSLFNNDFNDKITGGTPIANCTFTGAPNRPGCANYGSFPTQEFFSQSVNVDKAITRGAEVSLRVPVLNTWQASGNYTHTFSEQLSGGSIGFPLANTPRHMANVRLAGPVTSRLDLWTAAEYRSSRARRMSSAANPAFDALGDFKGYTVLNLGITAQVAPIVRVRASVNNVLGTDFLQFASYQSGTQTLYTNLYNNHQEGRRLWLSTSIDF